MMRTRHRMLCLLAAFLFASTASADPTRIGSVKTSEYKSDPHRLFVLTDFDPRLGNEFADAFRSRFIDIVKACNVAVEVSVRTPLDLDENIHVKRMQAFMPDAVLRIMRNGGDLDVYGNVASSNYKVNLIDPKTNKFTWEAAVTFYRNAGEGSLAKRGEAFATELSDEMKTNKILGACNP